MLLMSLSITSGISSSGVNSDVKCQLSLKPITPWRYCWRWGLAVVALITPSYGIIIHNSDESIQYSAKLVGLWGLCWCKGSSIKCFPAIGYCGKFDQGQPSNHSTIRANSNKTRKKGFLALKWPLHAKSWARAGAVAIQGFQTNTRDFRPEHFLICNRGIS